MEIAIPEGLAAACRGSSERTAWLAELPERVDRLSTAWRIDVGPPAADATASWVAPAVGRDGQRSVLKLGMPHMEADDEIAGLRWWAGDPSVRLLRADEDLNAMLLERCEPGTPLRSLPEREQDPVIARLLRRAWRHPPPRGIFRPLTVMVEAWASESEASPGTWPDPGLTREGLELLRGLARDEVTPAVLITDLHAGNVLRSTREPWLVIDPKPFVGDPAYDATQHLLNCRGRLGEDPAGTVGRLAHLLEVDADRIRAWTFARLAAEPGSPWTPERFSLARALTPSSHGHG